MRLLTLLLLAGCAVDINIDDYTAVPNTSHLEPEVRTDVIRQTIHRKLDILFVVADADSMVDDQARLSGLAETFFEPLNELDLDWHVGVVRAFGDYSNQGPTLPTQPPSGFDSGLSPGAGLLGPSEPEGALLSVDGIRYFTNETPGVEQRFAEMVLLGSRGAGVEARIFDAIRKTFEGEAAWLNSGFRRDDALLHVIVVSDLDDTSEVEPEEVAAWLELQGEPESVALHSVTSPNGEECGKGAGHRVQAVQELVGGSFHSICGIHWPRNVAGEMDAVVERNRWFPLAQIAVPDTIDLVIEDGPWVYGGVLVEDGDDIEALRARCDIPCAAFRYDPVRNAVGFIDFQPSITAEVDVTYELARDWSPLDAATP